MAAPESRPPGVRKFLTVQGGSGGDGVEARLSALEAHMTHVVDDVREIKSDLRELTDKVDSNFRWLLAAGATGVTALLGVLARGFGWI